MSRPRRTGGARTAGGVEASVYRVRSASMASALVVSGPATPGVAGSVDAPRYRVRHTARFVVACSRQFAPFFGVTPGDLGQAMGLFGRLLNPLGGLAHLLGQRARSCQNVVKAGFGRRSSPCHPNLYLSLLRDKPRAGPPCSSGSLEPLGRMSLGSRGEQRRPTFV